MRLLALALSILILGPVLSAQEMTKKEKKAAQRTAQKEARQAFAEKQKVERQLLKSAKELYELQPMRFLLTAEQSGEAWTRAQIWLAQNPTGNVAPVETVTDSVIHTKQLSVGNFHTRGFATPPLAFTVTRLLKGDRVEFRVQ
ncbi:MAG: hypothetical protein K0U98_11525 [Deltaproteobacteria bacterium]|nr:hypothetical protein [Deltaproteobacteria bacterium]